MALSVAIGLYYVAELAEEYPSLAGKCIKFATCVVLILHVILMLDGLPWYNSLVGLLCHCVYASLLRDFPFINTLSLEALLSVVAFLVSHVVWFQFFTDIEFGGIRYDFLTILGFFFVMLWVIPIGLFISMSINDNVLPGAGIGPSNAASNGINGGKRNIFKSLFDFVVNTITPLLESSGKLSKIVMKKFDKNS